MRFDIKTVSEANQREHWAVKAKRKREQQEAFAWQWLVNLKALGTVSIPIPGIITFTRFSCNTLDQDNLAGAFKHVQDQLAREIGIDDGDPCITWQYKQERIRKREHYFTVTIEAMTNG